MSDKIDWPVNSKQLAKAAKTKHAQLKSVGRTPNRILVGVYTAGVENPVITAFEFGWDEVEKNTIDGLADIAKTRFHLWVADSKEFDQKVGG